jgi:hypothetical protein
LSLATMISWNSSFATGRLLFTMCMSPDVELTVKYDDTLYRK